MGTSMRIFEDLYEEEFDLVGIHTGMEDFALAFALNRVFKIRLQRTTKDIEFTPRINYPCFEWKDELLDRNWMLFVNSCITSQQTKPNGLFPDEPSYTMHSLIPEHKEVNYLLKIDEGQGTNELIQEIKAIPKIITAYAITTDKLKSKPNLIY